MLAAAEHSREPWVGWVALTAALLAGMAAVASNLSGHHQSEGVLDQIKASDQWAYYQAKGIKADILKAVKPEATDIGRYADQQRKIKEDAEGFEHSSERHMRLHVTFGKSVTFSQIAIAMAAITVLTRIRWFWLVSLGFGVVGVVYMVLGFMG